MTVARSLSGASAMLALMILTACAPAPCSTCSLGEPPPKVFGVYAVWMADAHDANRGEIDRFLDCLIHGSTLNQFWRGEAVLEMRGSWSLPPPKTSIHWEELPGVWLDPAVGAPSGLPAARGDEIPLYLVFAARERVHVGACGINAQAKIGGRNAGVGIVRVGESCWPTGDSLRSETQIAMHELVETVDRVLGYGTCAAGGACGGSSICPDFCDAFVGLACEGAPTGSPTGCAGRRVDGWVVQKLGYGGREPGRCDTCGPCEFTPVACAADAPACSVVGRRAERSR
jgi:hypothetical protein